MQNDHLSEKFHAAIRLFDAPGYSFQVRYNAGDANHEEFNVYTDATSTDGKPIAGRVRTEIVTEQDGRYQQVVGLPQQYIKHTLADTFIDALPEGEIEALRRRAADAGMPLHKVDVHVTVRDYRGNAIGEDDTITMKRAFNRSGGVRQPDLKTCVELRLSPGGEIEQILEGTFWGDAGAKGSAPALEAGKNATLVPVNGEIVRVFDDMFERHGKPSPLKKARHCLWG